jgi:arginase
MVRKSKRSESREVNIIGVPLDHGAGRRGVGMGPSAIRIAGLHKALKRLGYNLTDLGDLSIPAPETQPEAEVNAKFLPLITRACQDIAEKVVDSLSAGAFPLVIGGDHSIAIGSISGVATHLRSVYGETNLDHLGVIWFDAHGDSNTPASSPSGNIHGMPVATLIGNGPEPLTNIGYAGPKLRPRNLVMIGLRDIDAKERKFMNEAGIHTYTMSDIDRLGMSRVMDRALSIVTNGTDMLHISFDIDSLDPRVAPGTGTQSLGGLTYREAHLALEMVAETGGLTSFELAEVNPCLDDKNHTAELAVGLIASALGKRII